MKTQFIFRIMAALFVLVSAGNAFAQKVGTISTLAAVPIDGKSTIAKNDAEALDKTFKGITDVKWSKLNENFLVNFALDGQKNSVLYDKDGSIIYHVIFGFEKDLPKDVSDQIRKKYPASNVLRAFHVLQGDTDAWFVNMEEYKYLIKARIEGGQLTELSRLKNQNFQ